MADVFSTREEHASDEPDGELEPLRCGAAALSSAYRSRSLSKRVSETALQLGSSVWLLNESGRDNALKPPPRLRF
jgi:hypothetical protein